jgi:hypothetical protein
VRITTKSALSEGQDLFLNEDVIPKVIHHSTGPIRIRNLELEVRFDREFEKKRKTSSLNI